MKKTTINKITKNLFGILTSKVYNHGGCILNIEFRS